ncbi:MAG: HAD-IA family hydrolase [Geminicoccaceae bacterium]
MRLIVFDCDGTLVDSQHLIIDATRVAFETQGLPPPADEAVRHVVGLSLGEAIGQLVPGVGHADVALLVDGYKQAFAAMRRQPLFHEPLFEGARETLQELERRGHLLAVATGKSDRGIASVLQHHALAGLFVSLQTADRHPSKPHPSMLAAAMRETGSTPRETLMVGDTSYDMQMARAAGVRAIGVGWGYHPAVALELAGAEAIVDRFEQLLELAAAPA